jgi:hypothetical protein
MGLSNLTEGHSCCNDAIDFLLLNISNKSRIFTEPDKQQQQEPAARTEPVTTTKPDNGPNHPYL